MICNKGDLVDVQGFSISDFWLSQLGWDDLNVLRIPERGYIQLMQLQMHRTVAE